jgi:alpha-N-arabinofuranosidase
LPITFDAGTFRFGDVSVPRIDAIAARAQNGKLWIALTNVDANAPAQIDAQFQGIRARTASGTVLTADRVDAVNTYDKPDSVVPRQIAAQVSNGRISLTLPPRSVTVLSVTQ